MMNRRVSSCRQDSLGSTHHHHHLHPSNKVPQNVDSLTYIDDESDVWRAHYSLEHYQHRGTFWNAEKHTTFIQYLLIAAVGIAQALVAYLTNLSSAYLISHKYSHVHDLLQQSDRTLEAFGYFVSVQLGLAMIASLFVWIEPVAAGSGIPEVKIYLVRCGTFRLLVFGSKIFSYFFLLVKCQERSGSSSCSGTKNTFV